MFLKAFKGTLYKYKDRKYGLSFFEQEKLSNPPN